MMSSCTDLSDSQKVFEYAHAFIISKTMFTASELGVFDLLRESEVPLSSAAIAECLKTSIRGMEALLNSCVGLKFLEAEKKNDKVFFRNTELANLYLAKKSPKSVYHMMMHNSHSLYLSFQYMTDAVREGKHQFEKLFDISKDDVFANLYRSEEAMMTFMNSMDAMWNICGLDVVSAFDLSPFINICDLGGCTGAVAKHWISVYPKAIVTIYDLPNVLQVTKKNFIPPEEPRIILHEGDFFKDPIPEADLYIMSRIIHDWTEQKCLQLLSKVYEACKYGGGVLLVEALLNEDKCGPIEAHIFNLMMLLRTEGGERSPSEYSKLLTAAGFREIQIQTSGKLYNSIFARK